MCAHMTICQHRKRHYDLNCRCLCFLFWFVCLFFLLAELQGCRRLSYSLISHIFLCRFLGCKASVLYGAGSFAEETAYLRQLFIVSIQSR